jgi:GTP-binding protein HflX
LKVNDKPIILVFNKIDQLQEPLVQHIDDDDIQEEIPYIQRLKNTWIAKENAPVIFISASNKTNIDELKQMLLEKIKPLMKAAY